MARRAAPKAGSSIRSREARRIVGWAKRSVPTFSCTERKWWARFALPTLQLVAQFTELFTTTSISLAPGRLNAVNIAAFLKDEPAGGTK